MQRKGLSEEDAMKELKKRAQAALENQASVKPSEKTRVIDDAKKWKAKTDNEATHKEAVNEAQTEKYSDSVVQGGQKNLQELISTYAKVEKEVPDFLKATDIQHSPEAAVFVSRVAQLPKDLQKNPEVLYKEAARLYWSMKWTEAAPEAVREVRGLLDRTFDHIRTDLAPTSPDFAATNDGLMKGFDRRVDIYRTRRVDIQEIEEAPDDVSNRNDPEYKQKHKEWQDKKVKQLQQQNIHDYLLETQIELDNPGNAGLELQEKILEQAYGDIESKLKEPIRKDGDIRVFDRKDAEQFIERIKEERNRVNNFVQKEKDMHGHEVRQKELTDRALAEGRIIVWTDEMSRQFGPRFREGDQVTLPMGRGALEKSDVDLILQGFDGQRQWLANFRDREITPMKPYKPNIYAEGELHDFQKIVEYLWGEDTSYPKWLKEMGDSFEDIDSLGKAILNRPQGSKPEEFSQLLRFLTSDKLEMLRQTEFVEIAKPLYPEAINQVLDQDAQLYHQSLNYLLEEVDTPFGRLSRNDLLRKYEELYAKRAPGSPTGGLTFEQVVEMKSLMKRIDIVGQGVILREKHMLPANVGVHATLVDIQKRFLADKDQYQRAQVAGASQVELDALRGRMDKLAGDFNEAWTQYTYGYAAQISPEDTHTLRAVRNLSPVEMVVRERTIDTLRVELTRQGRDAQYIDHWIINNEWKIYESIFAARNISLGTGEAMEITAKRAQSSSLDLIYRLKRKPRTKDFMERSFAEPWTRVLNPHLCADDFKMGDVMGDQIRNLYYKHAFRIAGYKLDDALKNNSVSDSWKIIRETLVKNKAPEWVIIAEYAKNVLGLSYSEVVRPDLLMTGLQRVSTTWRDERIVLNQLREDFLRRTRAADLPVNAVPDNEALGLQFHVAATEEERFLAGKKMLQRETSVFMDLIGQDLQAEVAGKAGMTVNSEEWKLFKRTLSAAEKQLWLDEKLLYREFDLGNQTHFNELIPGVLKALVGDNGVTDVRLKQYLNAIKSAQEYMEATGANREMRLKNWAKHSFKNTLVLSGSDFNLKKANWMELNSFSLQRRINDFVGQAGAGALLREILYEHPEMYLYPRPGKEVEALVKLNEFIDKVVSYAGRPDGEVAAAPVLETMLDWNYNLAAHTWAGWVPGAVTFLRHAPFVEDAQHASEMMRKGYLGLMERLPGGKDFINTYKLKERPPSDWPVTLRQLVSPDVRWGGPEANAWDEFKTAGVLATAETLKMFRTHEGEKLFKHLQKKYRAGLFGRFRAVPRKYWWAIPVATVALALTTSIEEETKKDGGSHH